MANVLSTDKKIAVIGALAEGSSIRSIDTAYAWSHDTDDPENPRRHVTVLHIDPALSPLAAVRAAIMQEYRANAEA